MGVLKPYRVDRDPSASVPIRDTEAGIRRSRLCLAEITTDNPNVWFELGYAFAVPKDVILICSDERTEKYPFDVQHRSIISYTTGSPQDFDELRNGITERIKATLKKQEDLGIAVSSPVAETEGISQHELVALTSIMANSAISTAGTDVHTIQSDMSKAGFTEVAVSLAIRSLRTKGMITEFEVEDQNGYPWTQLRLEPKGDNWLINNQDKLVLRTEPYRDAEPSSDDDIPF